MKNTSKIKKSKIKSKIRVKLEAFNSQLIKESTQIIIETSQKTGCMVSGAIFLPTKRRLESVISGPRKHAQKTQYALFTHRRIIDIIDPSQNTIDELQHLKLPNGVLVLVRVKS